MANSNNIRASDVFLGRVGILVDVAFGVINKFVYSILHGLKSCNIEYGQWLALHLVKTEMG